MEKLCDIKHILVDAIYNLVTTKDLSEIDAHELGEVIDIVKDIHQIEYYHTVVESMENRQTDSTLTDEVKSRMYYHNPETETIEEVMEVINNIVDDSTPDEKMSVKQKLASFVNRM